MKVEIKRFEESANSVISRLFVDGVFVCFGIEPSRNTPVHPGHPCIQAGTYKVILTKSPHLGYECPEVLNVPGRSAIRWHIANFPKDVLGCIGVGLTHDQPDFVGASKAAFEKLMQLLLKDPNNITAVYTDPQ